MIFLDPDLDPDAAWNEKAPRSRSSAKLFPRNQRIPSARTLARFLRDAQSTLRLRGQVTVLLTTDSAIRRLNRKFRGKNKATDVLSFPAVKPLRVSEGEAPERVAGDLAISIQTARKQAADQGHALITELKVLILHGLLHLAGFDHENDDGEMARREQRLRARLRLPQGLIERNEKGLPV
jgi:probable rRNA maturation factor